MKRKFHRGEGRLIQIYSDADFARYFNGNDHSLRAELKPRYAAARPESRPDISIL
jgi:predicted transcriptional regulator